MSTTTREKMFTHWLMAEGYTLHRDTRMVDLQKCWDACWSMRGTQIECARLAKIEATRGKGDVALAKAGLL